MSLKTMLTKAVLACKTALGNRRNRSLLILAVITACVFALSSAATAQPAPPAKPAGAPAAGSALPNWHPPVGKRKIDPAELRKRMKEMRERRKKRGGEKLGGPRPAGGRPGAGRPGRPGAGRPGAARHGAGSPKPAAAPPKRLKPKYPVDAHGYCVGDGPNDVPKPINLVHGWLGYKDKYAAEDGMIGPTRPPRLAPRTADMSFGDNLKRQIPYWKWRLMPFPYRFENHDDHCDPKNQPIPLLANIINVGVLFYLLRRFGKKPLVEGLKSRKDNIMSEIDRARDIRRDAASRLHKYQDALDNLDDKLVSLRDQYAAEGDTEEKRLLNEMGETRDRMMEDAAFRVSQEGKGARDALSREALQEALAAAELLLEKGVTKADHDRLADEYLEQVGPALAEQLRNFNGSDDKA